MGEIRKDNLHESLIKELNELANIDLSGKQDKTDESLLTESKDVIGAINELFQNANNGKELIASAIGEPLNAEDTFSAMSTDINSLLSTFKTNMMNNGITIESGDKFKQLIDKIATMVEEGSGKGIQFAEGEGNWSTTFDNYNPTASITSVDIPMSLDFEPTYVFCLCEVEFRQTGMSNVLLTDVVLSNICENGLYPTVNSGFGQGVNIKMTNISSAGFTFKTTTETRSGYYHTSFGTVTKWYAIGVGEEDTTLRDSLASILEDEGVNVTEEDDIASLIGKVDEEFTKDNNTINTLNTEKTNLTNQVNSLNTNITLLTNQVNSLTSELAGKVTPAGTAVAGDVLSGKTFINSTGQTVTGTMVNRGGAQTVTPGTSNKTLSAGYYSGNITIAGDADLVAANIVSGKNIFGVAGSASKLPTAVAGTNVELGYIVTIMSYFSSSGYHKCFSCKPNVIGTVTVSCSSSTSNAIGYIYHKKNGSTVQSVNITSGSFSVNIGNIDGNSIIEYHRYGNTSDSLSHLKVSCNYS